jgi:argininosuccinate lyase
MVERWILRLKDKLEETLRIQGLTFEQVHSVMLDAVAELSKNNKYRAQTEKYYEVEQEIKDKILEKNKELMDLRKQLATNDEKMYEAIKKL